MNARMPPKQMKISSQGKLHTECHLAHLGGIRHDALCSCSQLRVGAQAAGQRCLHRVGEEDGAGMDQSKQAWQDASTPCRQGFDGPPCVLMDTSPPLPAR